MLRWLLIIFPSMHKVNISLCIVFLPVTEFAICHVVLVLFSEVVICVCSLVSLIVFHKVLQTHL
jgi:hypothetical protein